MYPAISFQMMTHAQDGFDASAHFRRFISVFTANLGINFQY